MKKKKKEEIKKRKKKEEKYIIFLGCFLLILLLVIFDLNYYSDKWNTTTILQRTHQQELLKKLLFIVLVSSSSRIGKNKNKIILEKEKQAKKLISYTLVPFYCNLSGIYFRLSSENYRLIDWLRHYFAFGLEKKNLKSSINSYIAYKMLMVNAIPAENTVYFQICPFYFLKKKRKKE